MTSRSDWNPNKNMAHNLLALGVFLLFAVAMTLGIGRQPQASSTTVNTNNNCQPTGSGKLSICVDLKYPNAAPAVGVTIEAKQGSQSLGARTTDNEGFARFKVTPDPNKKKLYGNPTLNIEQPGWRPISDNLPMTGKFVKSYTLQVLPNPNPTACPTTSPSASPSISPTPRPTPTATPTPSATPTHTATPISTLHRAWSVLNTFVVTPALAQNECSGDGILKGTVYYPGELPAGGASIIDNAMGEVAKTNNTNAYRVSRKFGPYSLYAKLNTKCSAVAPPFTLNAQTTPKETNFILDRDCSSGTGDEIGIVKVEDNKEGVGMPFELTLPGGTEVAYGDTNDGFSNAQVGRYTAKAGDRDQNGTFRPKEFFMGKDESCYRVIGYNEGVSGDLVANQTLTLTFRLTVYRDRSTPAGCSGDGSGLIRGHIGAQGRGNTRAGVVELTGGPSAPKEADANTLSGYVFNNLKFGTYNLKAKTTSPGCLTTQMVTVTIDASTPIKRDIYLSCIR